MHSSSKQIWVLPEIDMDSDEIGKLSLGLLSEARDIARKVDGRVAGLVFGGDGSQGRLAELKKLGLDSVHQFRNPLPKYLSADLCASLLAEKTLADKPWMLVMGDTTAGREIAPRLATLVDAGLITGCVKMDFENPEQPVFYRPSLGGQVYQQVVFLPGRIMLVTMDPKVLNVSHVVPAKETKFTVSEPSRPDIDSSVKRMGYLPADFKTVDVSEAEVIVSAGAGAVSDDLLPLVRELAALVEGSIGTTRPVVDEGKISKDRMIGQTGQLVSPGVYLALGISGANHHLGGIQESGIIVSVNRDRQAPIFQSSDLGINADLKEILPRLIARIKRSREKIG